MFSLKVLFQNQGNNRVADLSMYEYHQELTFQPTPGGLLLVVNTITTPTKINSHKLVTLLVLWNDVCKLAEKVKEVINDPNEFTEPVYFKSNSIGDIYTTIVIFFC